MEAQRRASLQARAAAALAAALVLVAATVSGVPLSETVSCHVCGPPSRGSSNLLFPGQPPPPACQAEPGPDDRVCPVDYKGCLTTYDGKALTRTCADYTNGPCQVANGVVYCYCSGRLCNAQTEQQMQQLLRAERADGPPGHRDDDEDDEDGDGGGAGSGDGDGSRPWDGSETPRLDDLVPDVFQPSTTTTVRSGAAGAASNDEFYMSGETTAGAGAGAGAAGATTESASRADGGKGSARGLEASIALALVAACAALARQ